MIAGLLTKQIAELFLMILLGFVLVKTKLLTEKDSKVISTVVLYAVNPCLILNAFQIEYSIEIRNGLILSFIAGILVHLVYIVLAQLFGKVFSLESIEKASIIYTNAGNLIIPLVMAILGKEWVVYTTGYIIVTTFFIWTHGRMLICEQKEFDLKNIFQNINVIASVVGIIMFIFHISLPSLLTETMDSLTVTIGPLSMIVAGMLIGGMDVKSFLTNKRVYGVTFLKMFVFPFIATVLLKYSPLVQLSQNGTMVLLITLLGSVAPTAASVTQIAQVYNRNSEYASAYYFLTTLLCIVTMPMFVWFYQAF